MEIRYMSLLRIASMIVVLTLVGRLLGFFRSIYLSSLYGTGMESDAFNIAATIPLTLFLVVPGAVNAILIPTMRGLMEKNQRTTELYHKMLTVILVIFVVLAGLGVAFSRELAAMFGLSGAKLELTADMLQWMWPSAIFIGLTGLWSSICNSHQHFFTPTLGTVANGALVIISMYVLVPIYGPNGLAMATTLGYLAAMLTMIPTLRRFGYDHRLSFAWKDDEALKGMGERVIPILIACVRPVRRRREAADFSASVPSSDTVWLAAGSVPREIPKSSRMDPRSGCRARIGRASEPLRNARRRCGPDKSEWALQLNRLSGFR
uniref:Predicted protein n=1 Tax=Physcomitrium patens TaxID=3218 RepID=A9U6Y9_PHYPA